MKRILLLLALACTSAIADDLVYRGADHTLRLTEAPCTSELSMSILATASDRPAKRGVLDYEGQKIPVCWVPIPEAGYVAAVAENGRGALFPMAGFRRQAGI